MLIAVVSDSWPVFWSSDAVSALASTAGLVLISVSKMFLESLIRSIFCSVSIMIILPGKMSISTSLFHSIISREINVLVSMSMIASVIGMVFIFLM